MNWLVKMFSRDEAPVVQVNTPSLAPQVRTLHDVIVDLELAGKDLAGAIEQSKIVTTLVADKKAAITALDTEYQQLKAAFEGAVQSLKTLV